MLTDNTFNRQMALLIRQLQEVANNLNIDIATLFQLIQEGRDLGIELDASSVDGFSVVGSLLDSNYLPKVEGNVLTMNWSGNTIMRMGDISPIPPTFSDPYQGLWASTVYTTDNSKTETYYKLQSIDGVGITPYIEITQNLSMSKNAFVKCKLHGTNIPSSSGYKGYFMGGKSKVPFASPLDTGWYSLTYKGRFYAPSTLPIDRTLPFTRNVNYNYDSKGVFHTITLNLPSPGNDSASITIKDGEVWLQSDPSDKNLLDIFIDITVMGEYV